MDIPKNVLQQFADGADSVTDNNASEAAEVAATEGTTEESISPVVEDYNEHEGGIEIATELPPDDDEDGDEDTDSEDYDSLDDDDDDDVISGISEDEVAAETSALDTYSTLIENELDEIKKTNTDYYKHASAKFSSLAKELFTLRKNLIINEGLTPEEADKAAKKRLNNIIEEDKHDWYTEHPEIVNIEVKASDADKVQFTPEQEKKLTVTKRIRFIPVEDIELQTLNIEEVPREEKFKLIHKKSCQLSNYGLPMFNARDFMRFKGATVLQLTDAVLIKRDEDGNIDEPRLGVLERQAQFIYENFIGSTTREKYDINDNVIMTYDDFIKWFKFDDMSTALYAIYVASSTEMITSGFNCFSNRCLQTLAPNRRKNGKQFDASYNTKTIISYDEMVDDQKAILDEILTYQDDREGMEQFQERSRVSFRVRSNYTENVYEFAMPSIHDRLVMMRLGGADSDAAGVNSSIVYASWTRAIYVYNGLGDNGKAKYIPLRTAEEILDYYRKMTETDRSLINMLLDNKAFEPVYRIPTRCPHCGNERTVIVDIENLVFLRARSIEAEIEL